MFDVSQVTSYSMILLCVFGALLVIGFLKGFLGGFWKSVIKLLLWVALAIAIFKFAPMVGAELASTGIVETLIGMLGDSEIVNFILGAIGPDAYVLLAGLAMLILGAIIIGLISMIAKAIFKRKRFFSRLLGAIFSLAFNAVIVTILFIISTSPLLFKGAQEHVDNDPYLSAFKGYVVTPVQEILDENNIPSTVEEIVLISIHQEPTAENVEKLFSVLELMGNPDETLEAVVEKDGSGNVTGLNQAKAADLYSDLVFTAKIINDMDEGSAKDGLNETFQLLLEEKLSSFIYEGTPIATVNVDDEEYDAMAVYMASLGFESSLEDTVNAIFVK